MGGRAGRCLATAPPREGAGARQAAGGRQGPRAETLPARGLRGSRSRLRLPPMATRPGSPALALGAASGPADSG